MQNILLLLAAAAPAVFAFPAFNKDANLDEHMDVARDIVARKAIGSGRTNCGPTPCTTFDAADQLVSVTGEYVYQSPAVSDIRGPCPGLNAAANHGYLPRSGIASIEETISGLGALYNMAPELAAALAAYAVAIDGNVVEGVWSIGGPLPTDLLTGAILGTGQGLSYSHNNYEGDGSIGRNDAYLDHGNAHSLNITKFKDVYALGGKEDRYTLDKFATRFSKTQDESIANNPYYFTGVFSTVVVVPAAYNFVINFMSNHSAEEPSGYLNGYNFKSFFGVTGDYPNLKWERGQERVPENWYRRPSDNQYDAADVFEDVALDYLQEPDSLKFGGNTGKPNSFVGVNPENLTGGVYNAQDLLKSDNLACFSFNLLQNGIPNFLDKPINELKPITDMIDKYIKPAFIGGLDCPQLGSFEFGLFSKFPGYKYSPTGPDTNYKA